VDEVKEIIIKKLMKNRKLNPQQVSTLEHSEIWISSMGKWFRDANNMGVRLAHVAKTREIVEFRPEEITSIQPSKEGFLLKKESGLVKAWKKRYFVLQNQRLEYSISEKEKGTPIGFLDLNVTFEVKTFPTDNSFSIVTNESSILLQCEGATSLQEWVDAIQSLTKTRKSYHASSSSWIREMKTKEKEGILYKQGYTVKNWKARWFVMRKGFLSYYAPENDGGLQIRGIIPLQSARIVWSSAEESPTNSLSFQVVTSQRIYHLYAENERDTEDWIDSIRKHVADIDKKIHGVSFMLGQ